MSTPERSSSSTLLEPEEPLLTKYSRHHELPISTLISILTHALVGLVAFLAGAAFFSWNSERALPEIAPLYVNDYEGGGGTLGQGGLNDNQTPKDAPLLQPTGDPNLPSLFPVTDEPPEPLALPSTSQIVKGKEKDALVKAGSPGKGGGEGGKDGTGIGRYSGPGKGTKKPDDRAARMKRWQVAINYIDGHDYLAKLANLQAIIAYPIGEHHFRLYRDLTHRPLEGSVVTTQEVNKLNQLHWRNDDPESVGGLATALGASERPALVYVFLPRSLEEELASVERAHSRMTEQELNAKQIFTKFRVERQGTNWLIKVLEQKPQAASKSK